MTHRPTCAAVGSTPMSAVAVAMVAIVKNRTFWRPTLSPSDPSTMPPSGRTRKETANPSMVTIRPFLPSMPSLKTDDAVLLFQPLLHRLPRSARVPVALRGGFSMFSCHEWFLISTDSWPPILARRRGVRFRTARNILRSEEHTSELQSRFDLVCRRLLEKKTPTRPPARRRDKQQTG